MIAGHRIDEAAVSAFASDAVIVIAHNALRPEVRWALLADFRTEGLGLFGDGSWMAQTRLWRIALGLSPERHRPLPSGSPGGRDCHSLLEILAHELATTSTPALAVLLEQARKKSMRVWAEQSPFALKDTLKRRGYRWSDGSDGRPRSWYVDVQENALEDEMIFLKTEIYLMDVEPRFQVLTPFNRFSARL
jgi:DNA polymerase-3 subunit epsilon